MYELTYTKITYDYDDCMIHVSTNYHRAKVTSGVFVLVFIGHPSKTNYVKMFLLSIIVHNVS